MWPSCWKWATGHFGALTGMCVKFGPPSRLSWVSRYEKLRPCSSGSLVKSMPGTTFWVQNADLLGLGEEVVDRPVEHHPPDRRDRDELLGDELGGVEDVEVEGVGELVVEHLHAELPLREVAGVDGVPQVTAVEVGVGAVDLHGLVPQHGLQALGFGFQWNLT